MKNMLFKEMAVFQPSSLSWNRTNLDFDVEQFSANAHAEEDIPFIELTHFLKRYI